MTTPTARELVKRATQCVICGTWVPGPRRKLDSHIRTDHPETYARQQRVRAELLGETP